MCNENIKKLPFWETIGRSFKYVLKNNRLLLALLPVVVGLTVIQALIGMPIMCAYNESFCTEGWQQTVSSAILVLVAVGVIISYCRSIICKENVEVISLKFLKRVVLYILWSMILTFVIGIPMALLIVILSLTGVATNILLLVTSLAFLLLGVVFAPLVVAFPALAVDDYKIVKISKLFSLAKGNKMSIFFGQLAIMVPYLILSNTFIYTYIFIGVNHYVVNLLFVMITAFLSVLDVSFRGAFFAHIYQFLKYYDKDKK